MIFPARSINVDRCVRYSQTFIVPRCLDLLSGTVISHLSSLLIYCNLHLSSLCMDWDIASTTYQLFFCVKKFRIGRNVSFFVNFIILISCNNTEINRLEFLYVVIKLNNSRLLLSSLFHLRLVVKEPYIKTFSSTCQSIVRHQNFIFLPSPIKFVFSHFLTNLHLPSSNLYLYVLCVIDSLYLFITYFLVYLKTCKNYNH